MILRSLTVSNWRCFVAPVTLGPLGDGITVVHAPNGTGKSTLFQALLRAFLDHHRVTGAEMDALRPWGRALAPRVAVDFVHDNVSYRIEKQFLDSPSARLSRLENGAFVSLAEGDQADEQVRLVLASKPPGRGLARSENWGLAQVLWAPQGDLALPALSEDLVEGIRRSLNVQVTGPGAGPIESKLRDAYLELYTPKGKLKSGKDAPRVVRLAMDLVQAQAALVLARDAHRAFDEASRRVQDLAARRAQLVHDADALTTTLRDARARADEHARLKAALDQHQQRADALKDRCTAARKTIELIESATRELADAKTLGAALTAQLPLLATEVQLHATATATAKAALEDARALRRSADEAADLVAAARTYLDNLSSSTKLAARLAKIDKAERDLATLQTAAAALLAPDARTLTSIRKQLKLRDAAAAAIAAASITLELVPTKSLNVDVLEGEHPGPLTLPAGCPTTVHGSPEVALSLPNLRIRATGPTGDVAEHQKTLASARAKLADLTAPFATDDPDALDALRERAADLDQQRSKASSSLDALLDGETKPDLLKAEATLAALLSASPAWSQTPPDLAALRATADRLRSSSSTIAAELAWEKAHQAHSSAESARSSHATRLQDTEKLCLSLEQKLADLRADGLTDLARRAAQDDLLLQWGAAKAALAQAATQLQAFTDDPALTVARLDRQLQAATTDATLAQQASLRAETLLGSLAAQGTYGALATAEATLAQLTQDHAAESLRADALSFLYTTVQDVRTQALAAIAQPVEAKATRLFRSLAGPRYSRIRLADNLVPAFADPDTLSSPVPLSTLSGGEQEQLNLATRLALADTLRQSSRTLLVLDDVLTATDSPRLARALTVLEESSATLQLLILTCHPERYRGFTSAAFVDLEALIRSTP